MIKSSMKRVIALVWAILQGIDYKSLQLSLVEARWNISHS